MRTLSPLVTTSLMRGSVALTCLVALALPYAARAQWAGPPPQQQPGPTVVVMQQQAPPPAQVRIVHRSIPGLWITGLALLGVGYLSILPAAGGTVWAAVPVVGPWVISGQLECDGDFEGFCVLARFLVVFDALLQTTGAFLLTWGLIGRDVEVYGAYGRAEPPALSVLPWARADAAGLALSGRL